VVVRCLFCYHFGRESSPNGKRRKTGNIKRYEIGLFQPRLYKQHLDREHSKKWEEHQALDNNPEARNLFFGAVQAPFANTLNQSWGGGTPEPIIYQVKEGIVPGTATVESDFSLLKMTSCKHSTNLTDFSLESKLHAK
jgi:hypothetical protein